MSDIPTYIAGQTIRAGLIFDSYGRMPIHEITATFERDQPSPDASPIVLSSGNPDPANRHSNPMEIVLGYWVSINDLPGVYHCTSMEIAYEGGKVIPFYQPPNADFRIEEERIRPPEPRGEWTWLNG